MKTKHIEVSRVFNHPAEKLYKVISDYKAGLPTILPKQYFVGWDIERGGQGAGTVVRVTMDFFGKRFPFQLEVTEPKPGQVLVETDTDTGKYTRFTFKPAAGSKTIITIDSEIPVAPGFGGFMKAQNVAFFAKRIYKTELENLAKKLD